MQLLNCFSKFENKNIFCYFLFYLKFIKIILFLTYFKIYHIFEKIDKYYLHKNGILLV